VNTTVPVGVAPVPVTVAVTVTLLPGREGLSDETTDGLVTAPGS
jgi:hypothetical protein